jgi:hypothetical protein
MIRKAEKRVKFSLHESINSPTFNNLVITLLNL